MSKMEKKGKKVVGKKNNANPNNDPGGGGLG